MASKKTQHYKMHMIMLNLFYFYLFSF